MKIINYNYKIGGFTTDKSITFLLSLFFMKSQTFVAMTSKGIMFKLLLKKLQLIPTYF